ncbi:MAG TPA: prolipoprotein diacylglyceryl transferase [Trueperaceae bacterium]
MDPIMLQIGPLAIRWYGFLIAAGVLVGSLWATRLAPSRGVDPEKLLDSAPLLVVAGIIGARLVYVLTSPDAFFGPDGNWVDAFKVWQGGISIHGGILGIVLALWGYARVRKMNMWAALDVMTLVGALGIIGGRIGNFMNGSDTGGRPTDWAIGFDWPPPGTDTLGAFGRTIFGDPLWLYGPPACTNVAVGEPCTVHLTPLYGAIIGVILVFVCLWALGRSKAPGFAFWQFVLWYSVLRSLLEEPFRDNPLVWPVYLNESAGIGFFTLTQLVSIPIILVAIYILLTMDPDAEERRERLAMRARRR